MARRVTLDTTQFQHSNLLAGEQLVGECMQKLQEHRREFERCAERRQARLSLYRQCDLIVGKVRELFIVVCRGGGDGRHGRGGSGEEWTGGLGRDCFLNLHLSLKRMVNRDPSFPCLQNSVATCANYSTLCLSTLLTQQRPSSIATLTSGVPGSGLGR